MEKIILFLIVFGIGSLFEYLKKKGKERAESPRAATPRPTAHSGNPTAINQFLNLRYGLNVSNPTATVKPDEAPVSEKEGTDNPRTMPSPFLPGERHAITVPETDDAQMELTELEELPEITDKRPTETDSATAAHYERWRRAIIDTTILTPKFNSPS